MLSAIARQIIVEGIAGAATRKSRNLSAGYALYAAAGGIGIIAVVFFAIAVYGLLLTSFSMPAAAAMTGGGIVVIAAILVWIGNTVAEKKDRLRLSEEIKQVDTVINQVLDGVIGEIEDPIRENPKMALALAGLAGLMVGGRIH